ncbi:beta-N-acetylhexosaminidase [Rhizohabitans arisaemae]|uniref:beta-N-acetylhexosaminidase n=1 Tax=Rhizohabitans arisaemae TaxID=2720610 RepID=UPI0024B05460|nr:beta-N-acetylhexosaminidase [Rhizohabitans arisaemae]
MKRSTRLFGVLVSMVVLASCSAGEASRAASGSPSAPGTGGAPSATPLPSSAGIEVGPMLANMSLEDKVGQLFMPVVYGSRADTVSGENNARYGVPTFRKLIEKYRVGGVIYFPWAGNVESPEQVARLSNDLQRISKIPLLIGADQENGIVSRLEAITTRIPGAMAIGASRSPELAREVARVTGAELAAVGVNLDFAPVADVNVDPRNPVIGSRSFSSDPKLAARLTGASVEGFHEAGIASSAKHFPGHGDTYTDSHTGLPVITHSMAEWERIDAPPFKAAIERGVDAVMSAHIVMPKLDSSGEPATLSPRILTGLLREKLGFKGVVITDALNMDGVRKKYDDAEVAVRSVLAGADLLLMSPNLPAAYDGVLKAVKAGRISRDRLDLSVERLLTLKRDRGLFDTGETDAGRAGSILRSAAHREVAQRAADASVTVVKRGGLPVKRGDRVLVAGVVTADLAKELTELGAKVTEVQTGDSPSGSVIGTAAARAKGSDAVVVTTRNANPAQVALVGRLAKSGAPVVVVSVGEPYDLGRLRGADTTIALYSDSPPSLRAAAKAIMGRLKPTGKLPVAEPRR